MMETNGRRGGGDGVLHTYIRELEKVPIINPRLLTKQQADDLVGLFDAVAARPVLHTGEELTQPDRQALDRWAMQYLFGEDATDAQRAVELNLRDLVIERTLRAASGEDQIRAAAKRSGFNPVPVAARALLDIGLPPHIDGVTESINSGDLSALTIDIAPHDIGNVELGATLLDQGSVLINGAMVAQAPDDRAAEAVASFLTTNPAFVGAVDVDTDLIALDRAVAQWERSWQEWCKSISVYIVELYPRPQHALRRAQVIREVEQQAQLSAGSIARTVGEIR
ncbi:hypothetical protein [Mycobacteroides abscessus]|uniref:hypothetical protein n=1 Tax=Mycobacteroides abscessus TaxID=36809 RepID=UPI0010568774|nr:hypothetical protein [Mycobacteroides abscessus]